MKNKNKPILGNGHHSIEPQSPSVSFLCINDNKNFGPTVKIHLKVFLLESNNKELTQGHRDDLDKCDFFTYWEYVFYVVFWFCYY